MDGAQVITINKQRFVAGLYWQTLTKPRDFLREAKDIGRRENMDVVAIRRGRVLQAGFATRSSVGSGSYSLAATLAGILGADWIAVFDIGNEQYAIAAAKNGSIIPGCDDVGTREEILDRLRTNYNLHQFSQVICPTEFDFGGEEKDLADLLRSHKLLKDYRLRPLSGGRRLSRAWIYAGLLFIVVVGAAAGFLAYRKHEQEKAAAAAAAAEQQRLDALKAASGQDLAPVALTHPWAEQPTMHDMRVACVDALRAFPLSIGGWLVDSGSCTNSSVQATYKRTPGTTVNGFATQAQQQLGYRMDVVDEQGESATLSVTLAPLRAGGDDALLDLAQVGNAVRSVLQNREAQFSLTTKPAAPPPPPPLPGEPAKPAPPLPDWKTQSFAISGKQTPGDALAGLEDMPGMRLLSVSVKRTQSELEWSLTGEINGK